MIDASVHRQNLLSQTDVISTRCHILPGITIAKISHHRQ